jgi:hypothetical protein
MIAIKDKKYITDSELKRKREREELILAKYPNYPYDNDGRYIGCGSSSPSVSSPSSKDKHDYKCKCFLCIKRRPTFREKMVTK